LSRLSTRLQELISSSPRWSDRIEGRDSPDLQGVQSFQVESVVRPPTVVRSPSIAPKPPSVARRSVSDLRLNVPSSPIDLNRARSPPPVSPPIGFLSITEELPNSLQWPFTNEQPMSTANKRASRRMPGFVKGLWDKSPHRPSSPAFVKPSYAFFADGKSILLWTSRRVGYCGVDSTSIIGCEMGGIEQAAGGSQNIGVVALDGGVCRRSIISNAVMLTSYRFASSASTTTSKAAPHANFPSAAPRIPSPSPPTTNSSR
jgi:hypothetical protein